MKRPVIALLLICSLLFASSAFAVNPATESTEEALAALNNASYDAAYAYIKAGNVYKSGVKGAEAEAFQQLLVDLGANIAVDGNIGGQTMSSMNDIRAKFIDAEPVEQVDEAVFGELISYLRLADVKLSEDELVVGPSDDKAKWYILAGLKEQVGDYYTAERIFSQLTNYKDSAERAAACVQEWPYNGQVYRNEAFPGKNSGLMVTANREDGKATCVKVYTPKGVLVSTLFIDGANTAITRLPAGTYVIKCGVGTEWYGPEETFGGAGNGAQYFKLTFDDGGEELKMEQSMEYRITIDVEGINEGQEAVGASSEDWNNF